MSFRRSTPRIRRSRSALLSCSSIFGGTGGPLLLKKPSSETASITNVILVFMRLVLGLILLIAPAFADISRDEYRARRAELRKSLDGVMVLFGASESSDLHEGFFQDTNFL